MLTGKRPFTGEDLGEVLAAVIKEEPSWSGLPEQVRPLIQGCMAKDPNKRLRDIGDVDFLLRNSGPIAIQAAPPPQPSASRFLWPGIAAAAVILMAGVGFVHLREKPPAAPSTVRFQINPPEGVTFGSYIALSPDGTKLAFTGVTADSRTRLYIRSFDSLDSRVLPGTENAASPQWSPDGKFIAYGDAGKLKKVDVSGGPPQTLCDVDGIVGKGSWNKDGIIIFSNRATNPGVWKVPASGGTPVFVTKTDPKRGETYRAFPTFLPDGKHFLYTVNSSNPDFKGVYVGSIDVKPEEQNTDRIVATDFSPVYAHSEDPEKRRLLFLRDRTLIAQPFDLSTYKLTGDAAPVSDAQITTFGSFAVMTASENGALVYHAGDGGGINQLNWYDRQGKNLGRVGEAAFGGQPAISPDGSRVAYTSLKNRNTDVWLHDLTRNSSTRLTFTDAPEQAPLWSPDGQTIIFANTGNNEIRQKQSNGVSDERVLVKDKAPILPQDISRDGRFLLYVTQNAQTMADLWVLPLSGNEKPTPYLSGPKFENQARFSPDGRWVVYVSDESGRPEIYVQPFPATRDGGGKWMISSAGGLEPLWRKDGKEIDYIGINGDAMAVEIQPGTTFRPGIAKALFTSAFLSGMASIGTRSKPWDVSPDGQRFLITTPSGTSTAIPLTVLLNWQSELKK
jgi:eukaryotic-like serine/threonine-protein kinase